MGGRACLTAPAGGRTGPSIGGRQPTPRWGYPGLGLWAPTDTTACRTVEKIGMVAVRLTHNAVVGYRRALAPSTSLSGAYGELRRALQQGRFEYRAPSWVSRARKDNDGYVMLEGDLAALPVRGGRAIACLANPTQ
jgi:hypothetical protein